MESRSTERTSNFGNDKGQNIFYRNWVNGGRPKCVVIIIHGLNSHSGYYKNFAAQLNEHQYEVYALDLRGRGESDGERYYISDYRDIISDIDQLIEIIICEHPNRPIFLLGHSAGGVFASVYAVTHQAKLKGLIAESFAFHLPVPGFALAVMKLLGNLIPHTRLVKLNNQDFSRDQSVVETMNNDPLLANEKQPAKTMQQLLYAADFLKNNMSEINLPLLILHGTADKATNPSGSKYFFEQASSTDKRLKLYEGHYHDLLNDKYHGIVVKDILRWLHERI
ncbi:lysophospholipase [Dyadobacter sp. CY345]|uniref:alpha/beta hydrolase n=1 Tax=Dyadobacter sp. CY345 TaxID=2909335 RepID=UPI001F371E68|nr:alpha/beta hydrolase [Dyadobacter sp. CY345]MCF2446604.1 lysophospholipase [Dyadobacter sp. CY345]